MTEMVKEIISRICSTPFLLPEWVRQQVQYNTRYVDYTNDVLRSKKDG